MHTYVCMHLCIIRRRYQGITNAGDALQICENDRFGSSSGDQHSIVVVALWSRIIASHPCFFADVSTCAATHMNEGNGRAFTVKPLFDYSFKGNHSKYLRNQGQFRSNISKRIVNHWRIHFND